MELPKDGINAGYLTNKVDHLRAIANEVSRVAREVGTEGKLGEQAAVPHGLYGSWKDLITNVNFMVANLTAQFRDIARVSKAVAMGDMSQKVCIPKKKKEKSANPIVTF